MKDLIKIAKTVVANANPRRERIFEDAEQQKARLDALKTESKNEKIQEAKIAIKNAAQQRLENFEHKRQQEEIDDRDLSVEVTHAKYNASLLELDTQTMRYVLKREINLADAVNKSREYKKRLRHFLTACAHKDASKLDKALALLQTHMKSTQCASLSVPEIQGIMQHATPTQASYFKNFAHAIGVVTAQRSNSAPMEVNKDNEVYQDFVSL